MNYSLMFFSSDVSSEQPYHILLEAAKFADTHDFTAIWTPERHFEQFGGLFPNPALTCAAIAPITTRVQLRAGSLISPLHDVVRIAEEWGVVDVLSSGRAAISFGSGWNANDFVFFPNCYDERQKYMLSQIEQLQVLWQGGSIKRKNGCGMEIDVCTLPRPVQPILPVWLTSSGSLETFRLAGQRGYNLLTHMISQDKTELARKISVYREARSRSGYDRNGGCVSLMLHTFLGSADDHIKDLVRPYLREYLHSAIRLELSAAAGGGSVSGGLHTTPHEISPDIMEELLDITFDRYFDTAALMGTVESAKRVSASMEEIGVNEIACLIDFGIEPSSVLRSLQLLAQLQ